MIRATQYASVPLVALDTVQPSTILTGHETDIYFRQMFSFAENLFRQGHAC